MYINVNNITCTRLACNVTTYKVTIMKTLHIVHHSGPHVIFVRTVQFKYNYTSVISLPIQDSSLFALVIHFGTLNAGLYYSASASKELKQISQGPEAVINFREALIALL